jgi:hypothetical protein
MTNGEATPRPSRRNRTFYQRIEPPRERKPSESRRTGAEASPSRLTWQLQAPAPPFTRDLQTRAVGRLCQTLFLRPRAAPIFSKSRGDLSFPACHSSFALPAAGRNTGVPPRWRRGIGWMADGRARWAGKVKQASRLPLPPQEKVGLRAATPPRVRHFSFGHDPKPA